MTVRFLVMRTRLRLATLLLALAALVAACGGSSDDAAPTETDAAETESVAVPTESPDVPADAIAVVAGTPVWKSAYERLFEQAKKAYEAQGREFPVAGTPEYEELKQQAVEVLVQRVEFALEAEQLGLEVTDSEISAKLTELKDQYFQGDEEAYQAELETLGLTEEDVRADIRANLVSEAINAEVTKDAAVTAEEVQAYYDENADQFETPESREVAHILVETEAEAKELLDQLADGADFAKLAKEKSLDTASGQDGGKLTARRGELVEPFEQAAFALETGGLSDPVESEYGWHVIKALGDVEPQVVTPFADVEEAIRDQLLQAARNELMAAWVTETTEKYAVQIVYATGFAPPPTIAPPETATAP